MESYIYNIVCVIECVFKPVSVFIRDLWACVLRLSVILSLCVYFPSFSSFALFCFSFFFICLFCFVCLVSFNSLSSLVHTRTLSLSISHSRCSIFRVFIRLAFWFRVFFFFIVRAVLFFLLADHKLTHKSRKIERILLRNVFSQLSVFC